MYRKTYIMFAVMFLMGLPSYLGAQTDHYSTAPRSVRLPWPRDDKAWGYEVVIDAELQGAYREHSREFTHEFFMVASLTPGQYRYQVIPYNFLGKPEPEQSSAWRSFRVPPAVSSLDAESPIILIDLSDPAAFPEAENNNSPNVLTKRGTVFNGNGHSYEVINQRMNWTVANNYCERLGGHLATVTSSEEQRFIRELISKDGNKTVYWLGGYRAGSNWQWVHGEPFDYKNWMSGKPDNGREDRMAMFRAGLWDDLNNNGDGLDIGFICEWD